MGCTKCHRKYAQKHLSFFVKFVHTYLVTFAIIILVKTPQYIIKFLLHPIKRNTFSKKDSLDCLFYFLGYYDI